MLLLIDGYNLLHQSDLMGRGRGQHWLQRARERLLRQLQRSLDEPLASQTCIVFDAESPPPDRPHQHFHFGIRVLYSVGYPEADDLVEELIARHGAPQRLTVVSSDHRLQRAARRRRAHVFDSDVWYHRLLEKGPQLGIRWPPETPTLKDDRPPVVPEKLEGLASERDIEEWIEWFQQADQAISPDPAVSPENARRPTPLPRTLDPNRPPPDRRPPKPKKPTEEKKSPAEPSREKKNPATRRRTGKGAVRSQRPDGTHGSPDKPIDRSIENPFPEGYGEDLLEGEG